MAIINVDDAYILDETGAQVDKTTGIPFKDESLTEAEAAQARANIRAGSTNPNLLMNPFFTVNQRGVSGAVAGGKYGPDRWSLNASSSVSADMGTGYITLPAAGYEVIQTIEDLSSIYGKYVTFSLLDDAGEIRSATIQMPTSPSVQNYINSTINGVRLRLRYLNPNWRVFMDAQDGSAHTIKSAKLEVGSVSTLANDAAPDYGTELMKCRYYFRRIKTNAAGAISMAYASSTTRADWYDYTQGVPMRPTTTPTATFNGSFNLYNGSNHAVSAIYAIANGTQYNLRIDTTGLTANQAVVFSAGGAANIDISHDI